VQDVAASGYHVHSWSHLRELLKRRAIEVIMDYERERSGLDSLALFTCSKQCEGVDLSKETEVLPSVPSVTCKRQRSDPQADFFAECGNPEADSLPPGKSQTHPLGICTSTVESSFVLCPLSADRIAGILESLNDCHGPPWTLQRLCEVLAAPRRYYKTTDKLCNALETLLGVGGGAGTRLSLAHSSRKLPLLSHSAYNVFYPVAKPPHERVFILSPTSADGNPPLPPSRLPPSQPPPPLPVTPFPVGGGAAFIK